MGAAYGRKMMKGYLKGVKGINVSERKLRTIMPSLAPVNHSLRQSNSLERRNPAIYSARYFGHKIHLDQNEKLVHYGVTCYGKGWLLWENNCSYSYATKE